MPTSANGAPRAQVGPRAAAPPLSRMAAAGAEAAQVADAAVLEWKGVHDSLSPLIGQRGAAALYRRALHLTRADRPWLDGAYMGAVEPGDFASYHSALSQQDSIIAAGAHDEMLRALRELLANLIGVSLTDRLLPATLASSSAGKTVQDPLP